MSCYRLSLSRSVSPIRSRDILIEARNPRNAGEVDDIVILCHSVEIAQLVQTESPYLRLYKWPRALLANTGSASFSVPYALDSSPLFDSSSLLRLSRFFMLSNFSEGSRYVPSDNTSLDRSLTQYSWYSGQQARSGGLRSRRVISRDSKVIGCLRLLIEVESAWLSSKKG
jgi:hypothetical protein